MFHDRLINNFYIINNIEIANRILSEIQIQLGQLIPRPNLLSDHINKQIPSLMDNSLPPIKVIHVRKFTGCHLPIGVKCDELTNLLLFVCSSNAIQIYNNFSGKLIRTIQESDVDYKGKFTLDRPSALLVSKNNSEMLVKDNKEILVFSISGENIFEKKYEFVRRFGQKYLHKPYGLAFDSDENVVVIDYVGEMSYLCSFNKTTGHLISKQPYIKQSSIRFISIKQNKVFATDFFQQKIHVINLNATPNLIVGTCGKDETSRPSGIYVENECNAIMVADSMHNKIHVKDKFLIKAN